VNAAQSSTLGIDVQGLYELWGEGATFEEMEEAIRRFPEERKQPWLQPEQSFRVRCFVCAH
jgi:tRNA (guanine10-N2)-methyltransferase